MKLRFNFIKFLISVFVIFALFVALYQFYNYLYKAPATEYAVEITCEDKVGVVGYFVRDESVINTSGSKYYDVIISNGGKISKNGTIANVYSTDNAAKIQTDIRDLQKKIDELKSIVSATSSYKDEISYDSEIQKYSLSTNSMIASGDPNQAFEAASELMTGITKSKIANGEIIDYSSKLKQLEAQMETLKNQSSSIVKYITSPKSGYFSYKVDGVETLLNTKTLDEITPELYNKIENICNSAQANSNAIGKVVEGSEWRVCFKGKASKFERVKMGSTLYIRLPSVTENKIKCNVVSISFDDEYAYVVLESNMVSGDIISQRVCPIDIIIDSYSGLRIDKNAIRKINSEDGVFIKSNGIVRYRKVDILYFASDFAVVKYDSLDPSGVQVYDEVIVKGSDLYDGKVIA